MTKINEKKLRWKKFWERNKQSNGYLLRRKTKEESIKIFRAILLFGMCFMIIQPILNKISVSFMAEEDLYNTTVISIPEHFTTDNYKMAAQFMKYNVAIVNTFLISLSGAILQIFAATLVGYGFARFNFPLKKFWFTCVILVIIIPPQTIATSLMLNFTYFDFLGIVKLIKHGEYLNLKSSMAPYYLLSATCMGLKNGLYIFMIRQFFRTIPKELEEAAYVDGCGTFMTFTRIMLPDAKPILTSCFLFSFVWQWTDGFYTKIFVPEKVELLSKNVNIIADRLDAYVQTVLHNAAGATVGYANCILSTGTLMVIIPLLIIYLFAQKGFVESISASGIKM